MSKHAKPEPDAAKAQTVPIGKRGNPPPVIGQPQPSTGKHAGGER